MTTMTAREVALLANTTPKRLRAFIRAAAERGEPIVETVGSGARYSFTTDEARALIAAFEVRHISSGAPTTRSLEELKELLEGTDDEVDDEDDLED